MTTRREVVARGAALVVVAAVGLPAASGVDLGDVVVDWPPTGKAPWVLFGGARGFKVGALVQCSWEGSPRVARSPRVTTWVVDRVEGDDCWMRLVPTTRVWGER